MFIDFNNPTFQIILVLTILLLLGLSITGTIGFVQTTGSSSSLNELQQQVENLQTTLTSTLNSTPAAPISKPGPEGPQGEPGKAGGTFSEHGPLTNLEFPNLRLDRMAQTGTKSIAYLNDGNLSTNQVWTLTNDNKLQNKYGGCLYADNEGRVYMASCRDEDQDGLTWEYDNHGRFKLKNDNSKCLTIEGRGLFDDAFKEARVNTVGLSKQTLDSLKMKKLYQVEMKNCENISKDMDSPVNKQKWSFFGGSLNTTSCK